MRSHRLATIDLGSNTVRYLCVDVDGTGDWRAVDQAQRVTRLGEGMAASGRLGEAPMARTAAAVAEYAERARRLGAGDVRVVATSAAREATNGAAFAAAIERATGLAVRIVSGEAEARLTVRGVLRGLPGLAEPLLVFDIGGGSTEFILWRSGGVAMAISLRLGVVPLTERYPFPGRVEWRRYGDMSREIHDQLEREVPPSLSGAAAGTLVGTAGTVTTLAALDLGLGDYDAARVQGYRLTRAAIEAQLRRLGALTLDGRAALPCLEPGRADLIVPGIAIVIATMDRFGVADLVVSDWSLREGIVAELVEGGRSLPLTSIDRPSGPRLFLTSDMNDIAVLVLNHTFEPLQFTNARRAIILLLSGKAESVEASPRVMRSPSRAYPLPAVIRLGVYIRKPFLDRVAFNKKNILRRDGYSCQYCNRRGERLTVDHILPRSRGGQTTWTNVVAACLHCNLRKGNRLLEEVPMRLLREPVHPKFVFSTHMLKHPHASSLIDSWRKYLGIVTGAPS